MLRHAVEGHVSACTSAWSVTGKGCRRGGFRAECTVTQSIPPLETSQKPPRWSRGQAMPFRTRPFLVAYPFMRQAKCWKGRPELAVLTLGFLLALLLGGWFHHDHSHPMVRIHRHATIQAGAVCPAAQGP